MSLSFLKRWFPTTSHPLIISAPMLGISNGTLAAEVSKAGGFGIIPGGAMFAPDSEHIVFKALDEQLTIARQRLGLEQNPDDVLPVGVGFLTFHPSVAQFRENAIPLIVRHKPAAVWLFAPRPGTDIHRELIIILREAAASWGLKIMVQVGTVAAAREAVFQGADVIVAQGSDAGYHQWANSAGVVSLVPEVREMLSSEFPGREIALLATGGISDGSGVAAALALGAGGVVVGTRFLVTDESWASEYMKQVLLDTQDGGVSTEKSYLHDAMKGTGYWPRLYDGRAIVGPSIRDERAGLSLEDNITRYNDAESVGDMSRQVFWSGTGVGLVRERLPAGQLVEVVRRDAVRIIQELHSSLA